MSQDEEVSTKSHSSFTFLLDLVKRYTKFTKLNLQISLKINNTLKIINQTLFGSMMHLACYIKPK